MRKSRFLLAVLAVAVIPTLGFLRAASTPPAPSSYYRTVEKDGIWWFQNPSGTNFFSLGVNVVDVGATKDRYHGDKPEYASFLHYSSTSAWAKATLKRLQDWHFNTIGGWSDPILQGGPMPFTVVLNLGAAVHAPWGDLFSSEATQAFDETAKKQILTLRENPNLLGYFSDNELGWWGDTLFLEFIKQPATNHTRQQLIRLLRARYDGHFSELLKDFHVGSAKDFEEVGHRGGVTLQAGGRGSLAIDEFVQCLAARYYQLVHDSIRRYDEHHLILGDRFATWYPQAVARAAGPYVDVISINYAADWKDGQISPYLLDNLHNITGKPVLISEFYMCAKENRSGNKNSGGVFPTVLTQPERAAAFRTNLHNLVQLPFVIGAHWFQYYDEPKNGRSDGEDYNMGLVDIDDRPYEDLTGAAASLDVSKIHSQFREQTSSAMSFVQPLDSESLIWDQKLALVGGAHASDPTLPFAEIYAAWNRNSLYFVLYTSDYTDRHLYPQMQVPQSDAMEWIVAPGAKAQELEVRFGDRKPPLVRGGSGTAQMRQRSIRYMVVLKVPASAFGGGEFKEGDSVALESSFSSRGGYNPVHWARTLTLAPRMSEELQRPHAQ